MAWDLAAASDKVYQLLAQDRWFSPGTPASSTIKTGRYDIAEILLKMALNTKNANSNSIFSLLCCVVSTIVFRFVIRLTYDYPSDISKLS